MNRSKVINGYQVSMSDGRVQVHKKFANMNVTARKTFSYEGNIVNEYNSMKDMKSIKSFINSAHDSIIWME